MPYIQPERRAQLERGASPFTPGELNYAITRAIQRFMRLKRETSYQLLNDVLGALEGAKQEFYRRVVAPYENAKIAENGDIYE